LDGLRAVAVVLVISDHCGVPVFDQGYFGVDLFFVLSGFLITRLLVDEIDATGRIELWRFYLRRLLRLAPALLLFLAAYMLIAPSIWPQFDFLLHLRDAALVGFYLSDYSQAFWHNPKVLIHTWSLSVEEHFYLIWPFAVLLLARIGPAILWLGVELVHLGLLHLASVIDTPRVLVACSDATCLIHPASISRANFAHARVCGAPNGAHSHLSAHAGSIHACERRITACMRGHRLLLHRLI